MTDNLLISIKKLSNLGDLPLPSYATIDSAGMDVLAVISNNIILKPSERVLVPTGISIGLPKGFEAQVRPRSGLALKYGISVLNAPGTIDADYRGEIGVILINLGTEDFIITHGMKIAQIIIAPYNRISWNITEELDETERNSCGFGSTGIEIKIAPGESGN
jgi:dUTP pyrophosphatase